MTAGGGSDQGRTAMARTVLVVDDEPNIVLSLEFLIEQAGYEARVARDGEAALAAIEASKPDLVLLDVMLPKRDGFDVCETIRANPDWNDVRIVMLTAKGRDSERKKGLALGADAYITKPFSTREAMEQIKRFLDDGAPEP
jgi:DNA-binding response OmpR family regulator